jgi:cytochrome c
MKPLYRHASALACTIALAMPMVPARAASDAANGAKLYQGKCLACHSMDENEVGPRHRGVFNRKAGAVADYEYSKALKASGVVWNEKNLNQWLSGPEKFIPGQQMNIAVPSEQDRLDLIAYLKQASSAK